MRLPATTRGRTPLAMYHWRVLASITPKPLRFSSSRDIHGGRSFVVTSSLVRDHTYAYQCKLTARNAALKHSRPDRSALTYLVELAAVSQHSHGSQLNTCSRAVGADWVPWSMLPRGPPAYHHQSYEEEKTRTNICADPAVHKHTNCPLCATWRGILDLIFFTTRPYLAGRLEHCHNGARRPSLQDLTFQLLFTLFTLQLRPTWLPSTQ